MKKLPRVLIVVGVTTSGKTGLAIRLARQYDGEVISADSRQVYRGLDVGTAKVSKAERQSVAHHLLDVANVSEVYTAESFRRDARVAIADITNRGKLPILAGGTGFYVDMALGRCDTPPAPPNPTLRARLGEKTTTELYKLLCKQDPSRARTIDPHNHRRLTRALEIVVALGSVPSKNANIPYDTLWLGVRQSKAVTRKRIETRARAWLSKAFHDEVTWLLAQDLPPDRLVEFGFEYTVGIAWVKGKLTDQQFVEQLVAKNWQYAKRQLTWLKKNPHLHWLAPNDPTIDKLIGVWLRNS